MSKTSVEVDQDIVREAAAILGTRTLRDTIGPRALAAIAIVNTPWGPAFEAWWHTPFGFRLGAGGYALPRHSPLKPCGQG